MIRYEDNDLNAMEQTLWRFFAAMPASGPLALLLDYDGTLAPFHTDPAKAVPYPGVKGLLDRIQACKRTRMVIISGRQAKEVSRLLGLEEVEIWGCHGLERLHSDGTLESANLDERTLRAIQRTTAMLEGEGLADRIEHKPTANAVHWRGLPAEEVEAVREKVESVWAGLPDKDLLRMLRFDGGIEICAAAKNKGDVVLDIAAEMGEKCTMAYLGDDLTDEDAFVAIKGRGLGVLVKDTYRETSAEAWIRPPQEVIQFLENWATACGSCM